MAETPEQKTFVSREAVERTILFPEGLTIDLQGHWRGNKRLECKRWNTRKAYACSKLVSDILCSLFPNDVLFLTQIEWDQTATASSQLYDVCMNKVYDPMVRLVCTTLDITEEKDIAEFIETTMPIDILELFVAVVNQEINSSNVEAIIKKVQRLLVEKFQLDSDSLSLPNILAVLLQNPSTDSLPTSLLSSLIMPRSTITESG